MKVIRETLTTSNNSIFDVIQSKAVLKNNTDRTYFEKLLSKARSKGRVSGLSKNEFYLRTHSGSKFCFRLVK